MAARVLCPQSLWHALPERKITRGTNQETHNFHVFTDNQRPSFARASTSYSIVVLHGSLIPNSHHLAPSVAAFQNSRMTLERVNYTACAPSARGEPRNSTPGMRDKFLGGATHPFRAILGDDKMNLSSPNAASTPAPAVLRIPPIHLREDSTTAPI